MFKRIISTITAVVYSVSSVGMPIALIQYTPTTDPIELITPETETKTDKIVRAVDVSSDIYLYDSKINTDEVVDTTTEIKNEITEPNMPEEPEVFNDLYLSDSDIDLIALVAMAEAEGESELGKRLVIDVILNRLDSDLFPNTIEGVIYAEGAFECMWNGRVDRCYVMDDIRQLVIEEMNTRTNPDIHYFRADRYHGFGTPVISEGSHYFSTY